jgi:pyruvate kinase
MRRTKIVATIGPASRELETLVRMVDAGMDVARLNYSHGTLEEHAETVRRVRDAAGRAGRPVAILQDLPGPKLRIGPLSDGVVELTPGERLTFSCGNEEVSGDAHHMSVSWGGLPEAIEKDAILYLADGSVRLRAIEVRAQQGEVEVEVEIGGAVASRQGLNVPGPLMTLPSLPEEDLGLLRHGESIGVDMVALSFVQRPEDVEFVRRHTRLPLIAKMEKPQAVERAEEIVKAADCVMVARGDLGIELPIARVPIVQKQLLELAGFFARPSITATQMLDSMVASSRPTRAEVADVANAILDGTHPVMTSQQTPSAPSGRGRGDGSVAGGRVDRPCERWNESRVNRTASDPAVAHNLATRRASCASARSWSRRLGRSARLVSAHRPRCRSTRSRRPRDGPPRRLNGACRPRCLPRGDRGVDRDAARRSWSSAGAGAGSGRQPRRSRAPRTTSLVQIQVL